MEAFSDFLGGAEAEDERRVLGLVGGHELRNTQGTCGRSEGHVHE